MNLAFMQASGKVTDTSGAAVPSQPVLLCGKNLCLNGKTDGGGAYSIMQAQTLDRPFCKAGDGLAYSRVGVPVTSPSSTMLNEVVPALTDGKQNFAAGASSSAAGVKLGIPAAGTVAFEHRTRPTIARTTRSALPSCRARTSTR